MQQLIQPIYAPFGLGLALYFACQGVGRLVWPLVANLARLAVAAVGGWITARAYGLGPAGVFLAIALSLVVYASVIVAAMKAGAWRR